MTQSVENRSRRQQFMLTLFFSIVTAELFVMLLHAELSEKEPTKVHDVNIIANEKKLPVGHVNNSMPDEMKVSVEQLNRSQPDDQYLIQRKVHSLSRYLARGLRYEKNATMEAVGLKILSILQAGLPTLNFPNANLNEKITFIDYPVSKNIDLYKGKGFKVVTSLKQTIQGDKMSNLHVLLLDMIKRVSTELVVVNRGLNINPGDIHSLVNPILNKDADIVATTVINHKGQYEIGCFLKKMMWGKYRIFKGYDSKGWTGTYVHCDYVSGAFAVKKTVLRDILLKIQKNKVKYDVNVFPQLFNFFTENDFIIKVCVRCISEVTSKSEHVVLPMGKAEAVNFLKLTQSDLSVYIGPDNISYELTCGEAGIPRCYPVKGKGVLINKCCHKELDKLLLDTLKECDQRKWAYTLIAGTLLGSLKLDITLPWELDHDYQLDSAKIIPLRKLESYFRTKYGYRFIYDWKYMPGCVPKKGYLCGWIGIRSRNWRMEVPGRGTLYNDINRAGVDVTKTTRFRNSRVKGNGTQSNMSGYWSLTAASPGSYARLKYGKNCLKHVKHIYSMNMNHNRNYYHRKVFKWQPCEKPGYNGCFNEIPVDGNLGYRAVWV